MHSQFTEMFETIDRMDAEGFVRFLTEDASFRFGNMPAIVGRSAVRDAVATFFASIAGLSHRITGEWHFNDTAIVEGEVTYTRKDGSRVTIPFANFFDLVEVSPLSSASGNAPDPEGGFPAVLIRNYRIYIDLSPLVSSA